jgi:hypothetical protein
LAVVKRGCKARKRVPFTGGLRKMGWFIAYRWGVEVINAQRSRLQVQIRGKGGRGKSGAMDFSGEELWFKMSEYSAIVFTLLTSSARIVEVMKLSPRISQKMLRRHDTTKDLGAMGSL